MLQVAKGTYSVRPRKFSFGMQVEGYFEIKANGVLICRGTTKNIINSFTVGFSAKCFDQQFAGKTKLVQAKISDGLYSLLPKKVRVTSQKSWIEVDF